MRAISWLLNPVSTPPVTQGNGSLTAQHECTVCEAIFTNTADPQAHYIYGWLPCEWCGNKYKIMSALVKHRNACVLVPSILESNRLLDFWFKHSLANLSSFSVASPASNIHRPFQHPRTSRSLPSNPAARFSKKLDTANLCAHETTRRSNDPCAFLMLASRST